jgi:hypothetical protein
MPWIKRGMPVDVDGQRGVVTAGGPGGNVRVRLDGRKYSSTCHPHWRTTYYDDDGKVIADYK